MYIVTVGTRPDENTLYPEDAGDYVCGPMETREEAELFAAAVMTEWAMQPDRYFAYGEPFVEIECLVRLDARTAARNWFLTDDLKEQLEL